MAENPNQDVGLAVRLARIEASIEALRADLARYLAEHADHEDRLRVLEREQTRQKERVDTCGENLGSLSARVNAWGATNSLGAVLAAIIAWFR